MVIQVVTVMCRTGCCGELIAKKECPACFAMVKIVQFLDWRGSVRIKWMTDEECQIYRTMNGGFGTPAFLPDENPDKPILGFRAVAKRVLQELVMPTSWKLTHFVDRFSSTATTDPQPATKAHVSAVAA